MKNIHKAKFILIGLVIGIIASSFFVYADAIGQFILTKVNYPVVVNNQEYTNTELPVLNYQGNTYVPLKAVGKLLDAEIKWNDELKRVEIGDTNLSQNGTTETSQEAIELNVGDTYDNDNAKITFYDLKILPVHENVLKLDPKRTKEIRYTIKIELDENTIISGTMYSGYCITDNEKYNTPEGRITILGTGRIDYGETKTITLSDYNKENYKIKKVKLSFPALNIDNMILKIAD